MTDQPSSYAELLQLMRQRRSVRRFRPDPLPEPLLEQLLEATRWAPSASGRQAFRLILVTDREVIVEMRRAVERACERLASEATDERAREAAAYGGRYFLHFGGAPAVVVTIYRAGVDLLRPGQAKGDGTPRQLLDAISSFSAALMQLLLAAEALGLGACWMTGPLVAGEELRGLLQVPSGWELGAVVPVGFADEAPEAPRRRELRQLVRRID